MSRVRGTLLLNTVSFVQKTHGPDAHRQILDGLDPESARALEGPPRDAQWLPLRPVIAYIERAKDLYAPEDPGYFRAMGLFAGTTDRETRAMGVMVPDAETAAKMASVLWRHFFEDGRLEVVERTAFGARLRILDFPAHRPLCERIAGSLEGLLGTAAPGLTVEKTACVLCGDPHCEYMLRFAVVEGA